MTETRRLYSERVYENQGLLPLIEMLPRKGSTLLDLGCGSGANLEVARESGHFPIGLTLSDAEAKLCAARHHRVVVADISRDLPFRPATFDAIVLSHVLEHVADPSAVLKRCRPLLKSGGSLLVALPNVVYYKQRLAIMLGRFEYQESGILDRTHLRFFTPQTGRSLLEESGYRVRETRLDGGVPGLGFRDRFPAVWARLDHLGFRLSPGLFAYQMLFRATPADSDPKNSRSVC